MVCHKCGGRWKDAIIYRRRMQVCSSCGFIDNRNGSRGGVDHGPNSPLLIGDNAIPISLVEHLREWWNCRRPIFRPIKLIAFIKWSWGNWSQSWDKYNREQEEILNILKQGTKR